MPFADGALDAIEHARLITADGAVVPAQFEATATWWRKDGAVRWALVSATLERGIDYFVEYGTQVSAPQPQGMTVTETDDAIAIDTGPLQVTISRTRPTLLDSATVDGQAIITPEDATANLPTVVGGDGTEYPASPDGLQVGFFRRGPQETVIRREGWYTSAAGERYCQFITYTWFYAGSAAVRHDHTLVVAFDTTRNQIRDLRLAAPLGGEVVGAALAVNDAAESFAQNALPMRGADRGGRVRGHRCLRRSRGGSPRRGLGGWPASGRDGRLRQRARFLGAVPDGVGGHGGSRCGTPMAAA